MTTQEKIRDLRDKIMDLKYDINRMRMDGKKLDHYEKMIEQCRQEIKELKSQ